MPSRILALKVSPGGTAARTAAAMSCSSSGSPSRAAPPRWRLTSGAGQPKLRSMPAGASPARRAAFPARHCGSEPISCTRTGVPASVRAPASSSGPMRVKLFRGSRVPVTRTNSVTHQS
jgi:hypothetical protein